MVATTEKTANEQTSFILENIEYISPQSLATSFKMCPPAIYVRGEENLTKDRIDSMIVDLLFPLNNGEKKQSYIHKIVSPLVFFNLTEEQIENWGLTGVDSGVNYLLNGNTRFTAIIELLNKSVTTIADVPVQKLTLTESATEMTLYNLQTKWNDTTVPHTALSLIRSIGSFLVRQEKLGIPSADAVKAAVAATKKTPAYVGQAKMFLDTPDMSQEQLTDRSFLFGLLEDGKLSVDSCVTIMQYGKKSGKSYAKILKELEGEYEPSKKGTMFSKNQITEYIKGQESDDDKKNPPKDKTPLTGEKLETVKNSILNSFEELPNLSSKSSSLASTPEGLLIYKESSAKLLNVAKTLIEGIHPDTYEAVFSQVSELVSKLQSPDVIGKLEPERIAKIDSAIKKVFDSFQPKEEKVKGEAKEDEKTKLDGEQQEIGL